MKGLVKHFMLATALASAPAKAADDLGLRLHDTGIGQHGTRVSVSAGITIKLGSDRVVERSDRIKIGIAAGPVHIRPEPRAANGVARKEASLFSLETSPGYSTRLNIAGNAAFEHRTPLGAAQNSRAEQDRDQDMGDKVAWVAAVAGVLAILAVGGVVIAASANSD